MIRKNSLFVFLLFSALIITSCNQNVEVIPENIIQREEFIDILVDIQIFESMNKVKHERNQDDFKISEAYNWLFEKHGIDQKIFKSSFDYYANDPKRFEEIYDEVIIRLSEREAKELNAQPEVEEVH